MKVTTIWEKIAREILNVKKIYGVDIHPDLYEYLSDINRMTQQVDGELNSRQSIAAAIQAWKRITKKSPVVKCERVKTPESEPIFWIG